MHDYMENPLSNVNFQQYGGSRAETARQLLICGLEKKRQEALIEISKQEELKKIDYDYSQKKLLDKEQVRAAKELYSLTVFKSERGEILIHMDNPVKGTVTAPFCSAKNFTAVLYTAMTVRPTKGIYLLTITVAGKTVSVGLHAEDRGRGALIKKLQARGVNFFVSRRKLREAETAFENFVLEAAKEQIIPVSHGWNLSGSGWIFVRNGEPIWEDIRHVAE